MGDIRVEPVKAFHDNYIWMIHDGSRAVLVDPGVAAPAIEAIERNGLELAGIVLTHLHYDHNLGVPDLIARWNVPVFGPSLNEHDRHSHPPFPKPGTVPLDCVTHVVAEGDKVTLDGLDMALSVLAVPGHTRGHIAFLEPSRGWLFTGDTLFGGGCGKVFGGSMRAMAESLDSLASLPDGTQIYCAHEYTLANLRFALEVEPHNSALFTRFVTDALKRDRGLPTLPSTIGLERATNPFLRVREPQVLETLEIRRGIFAETRTESFSALRAWKDEFKV